MKKRSKKQIKKSTKSIEYNTKGSNAVKSDLKTEVVVSRCCVKKVLIKNLAKFTGNACGRFFLKIKLNGCNSYATKKLTNF